MPRIDNGMQQIYTKCTNQANKISQKEALLLIRRAHEINTSSSSSYHSNSHKGNHYLSVLMKDHKKDFTQEGCSMIEKYIATGRVPSERQITTSDRYYSHTNTVDHPSDISHRRSRRREERTHVTSEHPSDVAHESRGHRNRNHGRTEAISEGIESSGYAYETDGAMSEGALEYNSEGGRAGSVGAHGRRASATNTEAEISDIADVDEITNDNTVVGADEKLLVDWRADKSTWGCHWFPMQETRAGGDPVNNLYSDNGPLSKLDMLTGGKAQAYEYAHNRKSVDAGKEFGWWGHCNNSAEAACLLQAPKHDVVMTAQNGTQVRFSRNDIQGLLVKVVSNLSTKVDFRGNRFNNSSRDNPNDPRPDVFIQVMEEWTQDGIPFVLDIDRKEQVWNFPYDQVKIIESANPPEGYNASGVPNDGSVKYYHIEMSGTGYDEKRRIYEGYIKRDTSGEVLDSGWIKTQNNHNNPDFMWRPHPVGDLMDKTNWAVRGNPNNPEVDPQIVYDIYMKSLS